MLELRPYQQDALTAIEDAVKRGITRPLLALPTGTGKTVVFAHLVGKARREASEVLRISPQFSLEALQQNARFKDLSNLERGIAALRKAGLE